MSYVIDATPIRDHEVAAATHAVLIQVWQYDQYTKTVRWMDYYRGTLADARALLRHHEGKDSEPKWRAVHWIDRTPIATSDRPVQ